ncbi:hypothetical protein BDF22DRAFT_38727 [Syncephalis plumigaleata]|nr:hypothetical protein BDF22DRAFT_38727 [Syncephalis plumigaleata]
MKLFHSISLLMALCMTTCIQAQPVEFTHVPVKSLDRRANDAKVFEVPEKLKSIGLIGYFEQPDSLFQNLSEPIITETAGKVTSDGWSTPLRLPSDFGVSVITRKEFKILEKKGFTGKELYDIGSFYYMIYTTFDIECLGRTRTKNQEVWYLKVDSLVWKSVRDHVAKLYLERNGTPGAFNPDDFYPHIVLGQSGREDLPEEEVARGTNSRCVADVRTVGNPF